VKARFFISAALSLLVSALVPALAEISAPALVAMAPATVDELQEVVVTAQKRSENTVDVPITITAVSDVQLDRAGVTDTVSLGTLVPGLRFDQLDSNTQISIRGVGSALTGPGAGTDVPIYVDGVYQASQLGGEFDFVDVASVQVLKGPQGTLFGRNATGGAILITSKAPSFSPVFEVNVGYGNYNTEKGSLYASDKLWDDVAGSIAASVGRSDGYIKNIFTGENVDKSYDGTIHAQLLYTPNDRTTFRLSINHADLSDPTAVAYTPYNGMGGGSGLNSVGLGAIPNAGIIATRGEYLSAITPKHYNHQSSITLTGEFDFGWSTLKSITSGLYETDWEQVPFDGTQLSATGLQYATLERSYSQEFDLASLGKGPIDWVTGLYFFHDLGITNPLNLNFFQTPYFHYFSNSAMSQTAAAFADATYNVGDLHLTAGGRVSSDLADATYQDFLGIPSAPLQTRQVTSFIPRLVARYSITPRSSAYISWSKGQKSGIFDSASPELEYAKPEYLYDFEAGYKIAADRWQFEVSGFHYDYRDIQVSTAKNVALFWQNAQAAEIYGGEIHGIGQVLEHLKIDVGGAYTHGRYTNFQGAQGWAYYTPTPGGGCIAPASLSKGAVLATSPTPFCGNIAYTEDIANGVMQRSPEFSGNLGLTYDQNVLGGRFELSGIYSYTSRVYFDATQTYSQGGYGILNLTASWLDPSRHWAVTVYTKNLTNVVYRNQINESAFGNNQTFGMPRTVFVQLGYKL
jgi:iron complex outermembrane receptor protein